MDDPKQIAMEAWCYVSAGNIAVPANAAAAVRALTPYFERARAGGYRAGVEAAAAIADDWEVECCETLRMNVLADEIRALAADDKKDSHSKEPK